MHVGTLVVLLLLIQWSATVLSQLNEVPPCYTDVAAECAQNAVKSVTPTDCK